MRTKRIRKQSKLQTPRLMFAALAFSLSCLFADGSLGSDTNLSQPIYVTPIKQWEPGLVQGHGDGKFLYYNLPEFIANLDTEGKGKSYIRLKATLVARTKADAAVIDADLPLIRDGFSAYLRSLHPEDLLSPQLTKIRAELKKQVNTLIAPRKISDVLFQELLVQ